MDRVNDIEQKLAGWYAKAPHLPKSGQNWLADNIWWITLIGVILGGISCLGILVLATISTTALGVFMGPLGFALGATVTTLLFLSSAIGIVMLIIAASAVNELKAHRRRGWQLLFVIALIDAVLLVLAFVFSLHLDRLIQGAFGLAIGLYFLFEIRSYFATTKRTAAPAHDASAQSHP